MVLLVALVAAAALAAALTAALTAAPLPARAPSANRGLDPDRGGLLVGVVVVLVIEGVELRHAAVVLHAQRLARLILRLRLSPRRLLRPRPRPLLLALRLGVVVRGLCLEARDRLLVGAHVPPRVQLARQRLRHRAPHAARHGVGGGIVT